MMKLKLISIAGKKQLIVLMFGIGWMKDYAMQLQNGL
jgi:hypothetical protein